VIGALYQLDVSALVSGHCRAAALGSLHKQRRDHHQHRDDGAAQEAGTDTGGQSIDALKPLGHTRSGAQAHHRHEERNAGGEAPLDALAAGIRAGFLCGAIVSVGMVISAWFVRKGNGDAPGGHGGH
jgi:hypothetical protein